MRVRFPWPMAGIRLKRAYRKVRTLVIPPAQKAVSHQAQKCGTKCSPGSEYGCMLGYTHERWVYFHIQLTKILRSEVWQAMNEVKESIRLRFGNDPVTQLEELADVILSPIRRRA